VIGLHLDGARFVYNADPLLIVGVDCETLVADTRFDTAEMLDYFVEHGFNKIRIWNHSWIGHWTGPADAFLRPWAEVETPDGMRWDLDGWNETYWHRLATFCQQALDRDFIVEVSLFAEWVRDFGPFSVRGIHVSEWWRDKRARPEWNAQFNLNRAFSTNAAGDFWPEFFDEGYLERSATGKTVADYQKAYIDKVLATVDRFPNVYYELFNEFAPFGQLKGTAPGNTQQAAWQQRWARYLKQHSKRLVGLAAHQIGHEQVGLVGTEDYWDLPEVDVLNFHWYSDDPAAIGRLGSVLHPHGKASTNNEGAWFGVTGETDPVPEESDWIDRETRSVWGGYLCGSNYSLTEFPPDVSSERWRLVARRFAIWARIVRGLRFAAIEPYRPDGSSFDDLIRHGPATAWRLNAELGAQYIGYFWGAATEADLQIDLPAGSYQATWLDPRDGSTIARSQVTAAAGPTSIAAPDPAMWAPPAGLVLTIVSN
jgi:hypothetical protein